MELGARVCRPRAPDCVACPLKRRCAGRAAGDPQRFPERAARPEPQELVVEVGLFERDGRLLLCRGERPFLGEMWNLPYRVAAGPAGLPRESWPRLGLRLGPKRRLGEWRHGLSRYAIRQRVVSAPVELLAREGAPEYRWVGPDAPERRGLPAFASKLLDALSPVRTEPDPAAAAPAGSKRRR
jgi:A/G-specific adenine glycosylase